MLDGFNLRGGTAQPSLTLYSAVIKDKNRQAFSEEEIKYAVELMENKLMQFKSNIF